ncbi:MAG: multicopper oxidase domain-containing protein [Sphingobacteriales bacterium]
MRTLFLRNVKILLSCLTAMIAISQLQVVTAQTNLLNPSTQLQFVNPLPIPSVIDGRNGGTFTVSINQFYQDLGLRNPVSGQPMLTKVWGYNGTYPGPTIVARKNVPLQFYWSNDLYNPSTLQPLSHLLPIDESIDWALSGVNNWQQYGIPIVTHLHGGHTEAVSDGSPLSWFTPFFTKKGSQFQKGQNEPYTYSNDQDAATIWYHDHALGITRLNVYAGLAGFYVLTDDHEQQLQAEHKLPAAEYDMGLAIQDRMFTEDGQLFYPSQPEEEGQPSPSILPEFFGNFILVNGKAWPVLEVEPRQYRFRILNGSDSRFYNLFLSGNNTFWQIGSDQGLLTSPVLLNQMLLGPGQRKEVIIDFSDSALLGQTIILRNNAHSPYPKGQTASPKTSGQIMAFRVNKSLNTTIPLSELPATFHPSVTPLVQSGPTRKLLLFETEDEYDRIKPMLGTVDGGAMDFGDPVTENVRLNDTEVWEFYNTTVDAHPVHLHLVKFQVISRQRFNGILDRETGKLTNIRLIGQSQVNNLDLDGWKDTEVMLPGEVTRVIAKFDLPGRYEWHCHILSHEDHDMMRPFEVTEELITKARQTAPVLQSEAKDNLSVYPNPFAANTAIEYAVSVQSRVSIKVYDMTGREVSNVLEEIKPAGIYKLSFNGSRLPAGIYVCRMQINNRVLQQKLIIER